MAVMKGRAVRWGTGWVKDYNRDAAGELPALWL
jgi:hypothetical protein